jgi:hypothetical protein
LIVLGTGLVKFGCTRINPSLHQDPVEIVDGIVTRAKIAANRQQSPAIGGI